MASNPQETAVDDDLRDLLGDFARTGAFGWTVESVDWTRLADIRLVRDGAEFRVWIAPASLETGCYRATGRFLVGYRGQVLPADGLRVLDDIANRLRERESRPGADADFRWPRHKEAPDALRVSDGNLELRVTGRCNERCAFCNSSDWVENRMDGAGDVQRALQQAVERKVHTVHFTGGEPTLVPELPGWVVAAKRLGLRVMVQTNGLNLDREAFWDAFRDADGRRVLPDYLFVSLHTRHADRMKALTGVGGTFRKKVAGIRKALGNGVEVILNFVIQRRNLDELASFPRFVADTFGTRPSISLSVIAPTGSASRRPDLWPDMEELVPPLREALDSARSLGITASVPEVCGVPLCVLPTHRRCFEAWDRRQPGTVRPAEDRVKPPPCAACVLEDRCIGIWRRYADERGTSEFSPLRDLGPES